MWKNIRLCIGYDKHKNEGFEKYYNNGLCAYMYKTKCSYCEIVRMFNPKEFSYHTHKCKNEL